MHWSENIRNIVKDFNIEIEEIYAPWNRMFEIGMAISLKPKKQ